jgi:hypothetical protein
MQVKHLCNSCTKSYPECNGAIPVWGIDVNPDATGAEADAVLECNGYEKLTKTCYNCTLINNCVSSDMFSLCVPCADWTDKLQSALDAARKLGNISKEDILVEKLETTESKGFRLQASHPLFHQIVLDTVGMFKEAGGINYVTFSFISKECGEMNVTIQRAAGMTPAQHIDKLQKRIAELESILTDDGK